MEIHKGQIIGHKNVQHGHTIYYSYGDVESDVANAIVFGRKISENEYELGKFVYTIRAVQIDEDTRELYLESKRVR